MNFAVVPFVVVIGLASIAYVVSGRKWFTGPVRNIDTIVREEDGRVIHQTKRIVLISEDENPELEELDTRPAPL